jgi:hypothetical protein
MQQGSRIPPPQKKKFSAPMGISSLDENVENVEKLLKGKSVNRACKT